MSVWVTLEMHVKEGAFDRLLPFLEDNLPNVRGFAGARSVSVYFEADSDRFLLMEEWHSRRHHEDYIASISQSGIMTALMDFMRGPPKIQYYEKVSI
ncbi:MAG: antibiotic biosynthesis monooxygenase [Pseudomonadota bacterium]